MGLNMLLKYSLTIFIQEKNVFYINSHNTIKMMMRKKKYGKKTTVRFSGHKTAAPTTTAATNPIIIYGQ